MKNQFYAEDHILMVSAYPVPETHKHLAAHLIFADTGLLRCCIEGTEIKTSAVIISPDVMHTVSAENGNSIVLLLDPAGASAIQMGRTFLKDKHYCELPELLAQEIRRLWRQSDGEMETFDRELFDLPGLKPDPADKMDGRILRCIETLKAMDTVPEDVFSLACQEACLSQSRFSHLFKQTLGISFQRYLVLLKFKKAYEWYLKGMNITQLSMRAGFDSPSHFAAAMRRSFGLSFSDFSKNMVRGSEK